MENQKSKELQEIIQSSSINLDNLPSSPKTQKSTRTTFNLNKKTYEIMELLCENYRMKQKEFIDTVVVPNVSSLVSTPDFHKILSKEKYDQTNDQERKTFVLSKSSLKKLNELSKTAGIHRDVLFAIAVALQKLIFDNRRKKHMEALEILNKLSIEINETEEALTKLLGGDDPIQNRVGIISVVLDNLLMAVEAELNTGVPIDPDDFSQQG